MEKYLIIIAGPPATGKSYLINKLVTKLERSVVLAPDEFKIDMAESVGFNNLEEKEALEVKVWQLYYEAMELYMRVGKRYILTEYPFSYKQKRQLEELSNRYGYNPITIRLVADFDVLWERRRVRDREHSRHLSLIMNHYHYGDKLENRNEANCLITEENFKKIIDDRGYNTFQLGELFEYDVTDFSNVNYIPLFEYLKQLK